MKTLLTSLFIIFLSLDASALEVPGFTSPVVDQAGLLSSGLENDLASRLESIWRSGGSQIAVLTLPSLEGETIEGYSIKVIDQWKLGDPKKDNGVLLLVSVKDRVMRIEVGQGLEGDLPDVQAKRIVAEVVTPFFKNQEFETGIVEGVRNILAFTDPKASLGGSGPSRGRSGRSQSFNWIQLVLFLLFFFISSIFGRRRRGAWGLGRSGHWGAAALGGYTAGRSSGFGGGFGGFSGGGGGGFSGGGASGRW